MERQVPQESALQDFSVALNDLLSLKYPGYADDSTVVERYNQNRGKRT